MPLNVDLRKEMIIMKDLLKLQLFADETPTQGATEPNEGSKEQKGTTQPETASSKELKYSDEDVDKILNQKFAKWQKQQEKAVDEAKKLERMDAQQKAEYERDQLQKRLDELTEKNTIAEMTATARGMLEAENIRVSDTLIRSLVSKDAEETKSNIETFTKAFKTAVDNAVKERLKGTTPSKGSKSVSGGMTKAEILAIKNPELRQQKMLEHRELFNFK